MLRDYEVLVKKSNYLFAFRDSTFVNRAIITTVYTHTHTLVQKLLRI